jgi:hypothetical protein
MIEKSGCKLISITGDEGAPERVGEKSETGKEGKLWNQMENRKRTRHMPGIYFTKRLTAHFIYTKKKVRQVTILQ